MKKKKECKKNKIRRTKQNIWRPGIAGGGIRRERAQAGGMGIGGGGTLSIGTSGKGFVF